MLCSLCPKLVLKTESRQIRACFDGLVLAKKILILFCLIIYLFYPVLVRSVHLTLLVLQHCSFTTAELTQISTVSTNESAVSPLTFLLAKCPKPFISSLSFFVAADCCFHHFTNTTGGMSVSVT